MNEGPPEPGVWYDFPQTNAELLEQVLESILDWLTNEGRDLLTEVEDLNMSLAEVYEVLNKHFDAEEVAEMMTDMDQRSQIVTAMLCGIVTGVTYAQLNDHGRLSNPRVDN